MVIVEERNVSEDRRRHRRIPVQTSVHCRRLGRSGFDEDVESSDLSAGGAMLLADDRLGVGDVVILEVQVADMSLALRGLVVAIRPASRGGHARNVHVAFTGLSPERLERLCALLDRWDAESVSTTDSARTSVRRGP